MRKYVPKNPFRIINRALRDARVKNLGVAEGDWGVKEGGDGRWHIIGSCACPLGFCLAGKKVKPGDDKNVAATRVLGQTKAWVEAFIDGMDGNAYRVELKNRQAFNFGQRIRAKYISQEPMQVVLP